ncbi:MAG TPA: PIN domain-containing protein [Acidobacteriaceae bacterium]|jgi:predicted nucleic acid-binding protein|nr:PIN domain-containing protein [Acidobacteriaceae bacterium]
MPADAFFDTSVLIYTLVREDRRTAVAEELLLAGGLVSVQVLNELVAVARRKLNLSWKDIAGVLSAIRELCGPPLSLTLEVHEEALKRAERFGYHIYDSLVLASAIGADCRILYSEDMQDGQSIGKLRIHNPFRSIHS